LGCCIGFLVSLLIRRLRRGKKEIFSTWIKRWIVLYCVWEKHPLQSGCLPNWLIYLSVRGAHSVCRRGGHYFFRLFLLSRKVSNATIKLPKDISKPVFHWFGRLPPCHGYFSVIRILSQSDRNFNKSKILVCHVDLFDINIAV
jgi:hypothetical protein